MSAKADNRTSKALHFQCRVLTQVVYCQWRVFHAPALNALKKEIYRNRAVVQFHDSTKRSRPEP